MRPCTPSARVEDVDDGRPSLSSIRGRNGGVSDILVTGDIVVGIIATISDGLNVGNRKGDSHRQTCM